MKGNITPCMIIDYFVDWTLRSEVMNENFMDMDSARNHKISLICHMSVSTKYIPIKHHQTRGIDFTTHYA